MFGLPLVVVLVVRLAVFPDMTPIQVERFSSEKECKAAAKQLDSSTDLILVLTCEVDT